MLQKVIRETKEEKERRLEQLAQSERVKREQDKITRINLREAREEGWLGWHHHKQDPEFVMPHRRMYHADAALAAAIDPRGRLVTEPDASNAFDVEPGVSSTPRGRNQHATNTVHTPTGSSPAALWGSPTSSPLRGADMWAGHSAAQHIELIRALAEALQAGNGSSGIAVYERRVQEATQLLSKLKILGRATPLQKPKARPPNDVDTEANNQARSRIQAAVERATERSFSPPKAYTTLKKRQLPRGSKTPQSRSSNRKSTKLSMADETQPCADRTSSGQPTTRSPNTVSARSSARGRRGKPKPKRLDFEPLKLTETILEEPSQASDPALVPTHSATTQSSLRGREARKKIPKFPAGGYFKDLRLPA